MAVYQSLTLMQEGQDLENNTSQVRILWESTQTGGSYNNTPRQATWWAIINGGTELTDTAACTLPLQQTAVLADTVITVPHDDYGNATVTVRTWMDTHISAGVVELSKTLALTQIPRASSLTASNSVIGGCSYIAVGKKHPDYTHSIGYAFGDQTGFLTDLGQITQEEAIMGREEIRFQIPEQFYESLTAARQGVCALTCRTYYGQTLIGTPQTASFTVMVDETLCAPTVTGTVQDICQQTLALTGDGQVLVQNASQALCALTAEAKLGAALTLRQIAQLPLEEGEDSLVLDGVAGPVTFSVTDTRGFTATYTPETALIPYKKPTLRAKLWRTHATDGSAMLTVEGECFTGSFGQTENTLSAQYRIDQQDWQSLPLTATEGFFSGAVSLSGMDYDRLYAVTVQLQDCLTAAEKVLTLKKSVPVFDWGEADFRFHVPVDIQGGLTVEGKALLDWCYPVGSVYTGVGNAPDTLLGGSWSLLDTDEQGLCRWIREG